MKRYKLARPNKLIGMMIILAGLALLFLQSTGHMAFTNEWSKIMTIVFVFIPWILMLVGTVVYNPSEKILKIFQ